jgi:enolase
MICPVGATSFAVALRWAAEVYHHLKKVLLDRGYSVGVGDEGGFAPALKSNAEALDLIVQAIEAAGYQPGRDIALAIDPAASGFYDPKTRLYHLKSEQCSLSASELIDLYRQWIAAYPLILIEDGLAEDDWEGWKLLNTSLGNEVELVGDDLFVTSVARIERGIQQGVANAVLIKPNQVGTLTETLAAIRLAQAADWGAMVSHRSGETLDSFVADLSVGMNTGHMKAGAPCRGERLAKYNQLLRIEKFLGSDSTYAGASGFVHNRAKPSHAADT